MFQEQTLGKGSQKSKANLKRQKEKKKKSVKMKLECCIAIQNKTIENKWMDFRCKKSHMRKKKISVRNRL